MRRGTASATSWDVGALEGQLPARGCEMPSCSDQGRDYVTGEMWKSKPPFRPGNMETRPGAAKLGTGCASTRLLRRRSSGTASGGLTRIETHIAQCWGRSFDIVS